MFKLASHIVAHGPLHPGDAVGWVVRLCLALEVIHCARSSHGRISAKSVQMLGPSCHAAGFFLDGRDCVADMLYQSPERLLGEGPSPEDDTWALGVLLYFALTGTLPFVAEEAPELRARILWSKPKPLASFGLDHGCLQRVIDHVLAPDAAGRIRTATLLRTRLVGCHQSADKLSALKLGKPDLRALSDETDDSQGIKLTGVIDRQEMDRQIREVIARRKAARLEALRAVPPMEPDPWSEADTTRRRTLDAATRVQARGVEPPTTVRPASVVQSAAALVPGRASPSAVPAENALDEPTADTRVSRPPGSGVQARPHDSDERMWPSGSGVQSRPPGSGAHSPLPDSRARPLAAGSGSLEIPITLDTFESLDSGRLALGLSWDDMSESSVPPSARGLTLGLSESHGPERRAPAQSTQAPPWLADDTDSIPDMRSRWPKWVGAALLVALGAVAGYLVLGSGWPSPDPAPVDSNGGGGEAAPAVALQPDTTARARPDETAESSAVASASGAPVASSSPSSLVSATPSTATAASGSAAVEMATKSGADTSGCVGALFPEDTFRLRPPSFEFVCSEPDLRAGVTAVRVELVRARRTPGASEAMRELDELGWYQLALFAAARTACCAEPAALKTRAGVHQCPLDERLEQVGRAAAARDERALQAALEKFVQSIQCLARQGASAAFGPLRPPSTTAAALLHKMLARRDVEPAR